MIYHRSSNALHTLQSFCQLISHTNAKHTILEIHFSPPPRGETCQTPISLPASFGWPVNNGHRRHKMKKTKVKIKTLCFCQLDSTAFPEIHMTAERYWRTLKNRLSLAISNRNKKPIILVVNILNNT